MLYWLPGQGDPRPECRQENMMSKLTTLLMAGGAALTILSFSVETASAQGAWCAYQGGRNAYENCGYYTLEQCRAAVSGVGGDCRPNVRDGYGYGTAPYGYSDYYDQPPRSRYRRYQ
ncbi:MAG TPA: DUF3551 domain-containing protein [Xanthomonadaceae bacterium]|nr:DUF3551 domain-containing protein [Xanthomonadaceae bacterium]